MTTESEEKSDAIRRATRLVALIEPILCGQGPSAQGAALCVLTATWACGFVDKAERRAMLDMHIEQVRETMRDLEGKL